MPSFNDVVSWLRGQPRWTTYADGLNKVADGMLLLGLSSAVLGVGAPDVVAGVAGDERRRREACTRCQSVIISIS